MNKKFFAALASATMAFTASGSIAVFADDFVEEKTPVVDGNVVKPQEALTVKWDKEHFGDLATENGEVNPNVTWDGYTPQLDKDGLVKTEDLKNVRSITFEATFKGEIKGLNYFPGLETFNDSNATAVTNKTLDFSENTALKYLTVNKANELGEIVLPKATKTEDDLDVYHLEELNLQNTKLTSLDLSVYDSLTFVNASNNKNLKEVTLPKRTSLNKDEIALNGLVLSNNALETINLDYYTIKNNLFLDGNHIGALDLSKTTVVNGSAFLGNQTFYVSEQFGNVNLKETFENLDVDKVTATEFDKEKGLLTLEGAETTYSYATGATVKKGTSDLTVKIVKANPMNRLYNPNSGEHFYTADLNEKAALVALGWNDEGYGWVAPRVEKNVTEMTDQPVYRLYNPNAGDHHYTMDVNEVNTLKSFGWKDEGIGWFSAESKTANVDTVEVYRQYNPFANGAGSHNYTTDKAENDYLVSLGWTPEGTAWKAYR